VFPEALIFLHIPKAGGTTLRRVIERQYPKQSIFHIDGNRVRESIQDFKSLSEHERAHIKCLKGHMWFGLHEYFPQKATYITMLRDPVDRVMSHYYFVLRTPSHYLYEEVVSKNMDLESYVRSGISQELGNWQVKAISGIERVIMGYDNVTCDTLEAAKRNLSSHFIAVGLLEKFDESLLMFRRLLGWKNICYIRRNLGKRHGSEKQISAQARRVIEQHNDLDVQLYEYARELFEKKLIEENVAKKSLVFFRIINRIYQGSYRLGKRPFIENITRPLRSSKVLN